VEFDLLVVVILKRQLFEKITVHTPVVFGAAEST